MSTEKEIPKQSDKVQMTDGFYSYFEIKDAFNKDFRKEPEMCDFIEANIVEFCNDCLEIDYKSHKREFPLALTDKRIKGNRRIDFLITSKSGKNIIVECKTPKYESELTSGVGQTLAYISLLRGRGVSIHKSVIVSSKPDILVPRVVTDFQLPIEFMILDKSKFVKFSHYETN